ncbi:YqaJ viral recombinase family protein [Paracoccus sp. SSK6]|uniref:YqaJ viral recombinase family protein n=1 Tax=Paracoccus sp. SSK6 TaxID=3143131 RepID=UPI00321950C4
MAQTVKTRRGLAHEKNRAKWLATRARNINSSEVGALFGLSPYMTPLELYALKKGLIEDGFKDNDRAAAGRFLEAGIAAWACEKFGFKAKPLKDYLEDPKARTGSSFDWEITAWDDAPGAFEGRIPLEIKTVDYLGFNGSFKAGYTDRKWNADNPDDIVAPPAIELQVQHQMMLSGAPWAVIIVLVAGNQMHRIVRMRNETIIGKIRDRIAQFWLDVDFGREPTADYERDAETIKRLYVRPDPRAAVPAEQHARMMDAIDRACAAAEEKKAAAAIEEAAKAEVMDVLRETELAVLPDGSKASWKADKNGRRSLRLTAAPALDALAA